MNRSGMEAVTADRHSGRVIKSSAQRVRTELLLAHITHRGGLFWLARKLAMQPTQVFQRPTICSA